MITQAFVLAAGHGTRLRPLTDSLPKPLVPIFQKPLITFAFDHLIDAGIDRFIVNTHRLPEKFRETFAESSYCDRAIVLLHESDILGTGGGLKNAQPYLSAGSVVVYSGDILTDFNLRSLLEQHRDADNDVTLAVRQTPFKPTITLRGGRVADIGQTGDYDFANVSIWTHRAINLIPPRQSVSFIPTLKEIMAGDGKIGGVVVNEGKWFNIGSVPQYLEVHREIWKTKWRPDFLADTSWPSRLGERAHIATTAQILGCSVAGANCQVGDGAVLSDTILWPGARIAPGSELRNCIVRAGKVAEGTLENAIV